MDDMLRKGRMPDRHGEGAHHRKLNWDRVNELRSLADSGVSVQELQGKFGIGGTQVRRIIAREQWQ